MSAFLSVDMLTDFAAFCLTDFLDWRYIHSWFVFSTQLVNCCPHGRRNYTCVLLPLYCTFSLTSPSPPPPSQTKCTVYTDSVWVWGGGGVEMYCGPYFAGDLHSVSDQIQNLENFFTTPTKMTSKDDIKGLASLKFLRPWLSRSSAVLKRERNLNLFFYQQTESSSDRSDKFFCP
jgi:hypothetical protein